jgi:hypothetical protein
MNIDEFFGRLEGVVEILQVGPLAVGHVEGCLWSAFAERRRRPSDLGWRQQIPAAQDHSSDVTRLHGCYLAEGLPGVMRHGGCPLLFPLVPGGVSGSGQSW